MSNYQKGDIVEFINDKGLCEFGMIISVQISDTISALVVSGFSPAYPKWIPTERVKNHWKNLKGYILDIDLLKAKNKRLKSKLELIKKRILSNRNILLFSLKEKHDSAKYSEFAFCQSLLELINAKDTNVPTKLKGIEE